MANTVMGAVRQRFDDEISLADGAGGVWFNEVPEQYSTLPYVLIIDEGATPEWQADDNYREREKFRFEIYAVGLSNCGTVVNQIKQKFDMPDTTDARAALVIDGGEAIACYRMNTQFEAVGERTDTGELVFKGTLSYELMVHYTLTNS